MILIEAKTLQKPIDEKSLRRHLENMGFSIAYDTKNPSYYPWSLNLSTRSTLNYKVDFVIAKK